MEVNGVANIKLITELALSEGKIDKDVVRKIDEQIDLLLLYLRTYEECVKNNKPVIFWHQIKNINKEIV